MTTEEILVETAAEISAELAEAEDALVRAKAGVVEAANDREVARIMRDELLTVIAELPPNSRVADRIRERVRATRRAEGPAVLAEGVLKNALLHVAGLKDELAHIRAAMPEPEPKPDADAAGGAEAETVH